MQLNLPILHLLENSQNILIAGAGGGFDVFAGLPIYFTLREMGKNVHLANYSFTDFGLASIFGNPSIVIPHLLMRTSGALNSLNIPVSYFPEGFLTQWFLNERGEDVPVWMFARQGVAALKMCYGQAIQKLKIDTIIAVDGGVDSIMTGDEAGPGTLVEDSISIAAIIQTDVPVKILTCIGFGTEVEESVCHHNALDNIAALSKVGAFYGGCSLTPQMEAFQLFETACKYVWEQPNHPKSHISTRIIPAVNGEFGNYHLYEDDEHVKVFISPLMGLYWFFDMIAVAKRNRLIPQILITHTQDEVFQIALRMLRELRQVRPRLPIPY